MNKIRNGIHSNNWFSISDMLSECSGSGEKADCSDNSPDMFAEYSGPYEEICSDVKVQSEG
jgi:hypothetical protein